MVATDVAPVTMAAAAACGSGDLVDMPLLAHVAGDGGEGDVLSTFVKSCCSPPRSPAGSSSGAWSRREDSQSDRASTVTVDGDAAPWQSVREKLYRGKLRKSLAASAGASPSKAVWGQEPAADAAPEASLSAASSRSSFTTPPHLAIHPQNDYLTALVALPGTPTSSLLAQVCAQPPNVCAGGVRGVGALKDAAAAC